jgi:hypothetical protein
LYFVILIEPTEMTAVVAVAALLEVSGSCADAGAETVAVFEIEPVALVLTVAVTRNLAVAPLARSTVVEMLPMPVAPPQLPDPTVIVHVQEMLDREDGNVSATLAPVTSWGPPFVTSIV